MRRNSTQPRSAPSSPISASSPSARAVQPANDRRLAVRRAAHRQPERTGHRTCRVVLPAQEGLLQCHDHLVVAAHELRGGGQVVELGGRERGEAGCGPALERDVPVTPVEGGARLVSSRPQPSAEPPAASVRRIGGHGDPRRMLLAGDDPVDDVRRVAARTAEEHRAERVLEASDRRRRARAPRRPRRASRAGTRPRRAIGTRIQSKTCWKPVAHTTLATSRGVPSTSGGRPRDLLDPGGDALHAAGRQVRALDPEHRALRGSGLLHLLAAHRGASGEDVPPGEEQHREQQVQSRPSPAADGI